MKKTFSLILTLILGFQILNPLPVKANTSSTGSFESLNEAIQQSNLTLQLKQKLAQAQYRYYLLKNNLGKAKGNLEEVRSAIFNLEDLILNFNEEIDNVDDQILSVKRQSEEKKMQISEIEEEIQILELRKEDQLILIQELMELIYLNRGIYYDKGAINPIKVLANSESISKTLQNLTYLDLLEIENQNQILELEKISSSLSLKWNDLRVKRDELNILDAKLAKDMNQLKDQKSSQVALLEDLKSEELILETMLKSADDNEEDLLEEIQSLEQSLDQMQAVLEETIGNLSENQQDVIAKIEEEMSQKYSVTEASDLVNLAWPVSPGRGLTAMYSDSGYVELFGVQHGAVDIRSNQGSPVYASAEGVVFDIKFNPESTDYAYIMIAHRKGVMTLVGHISGLAQKDGGDIKVGDFVNQGDLIAFSGGNPKSIGAGPRTTGPHVHFEVWQDGARVDPLLYLPLEEVPSSDLPDKYIEEMQRDLENEITQIKESLGL